MRKLLFFTVLITCAHQLFSQQLTTPVPLSLFNLQYTANGRLALLGNDSITAIDRKDAYPLSSFTSIAEGTETGIQINTGMAGLNGTVAYGPIDELAVFPMVLFLPKEVPLVDGKALLEIKKVFVRSNDFFKYAEKGQGIIGYRIINQTGRIIYEGRVAFSGKGPYKAEPTIISGPSVNNLGPDSCVIAFETSSPLQTTLIAEGQRIRESAPALHHELTLKNLHPATVYTYIIEYGNRSTAHTFRTAPASGTRKPFVFAFASANRSGTGGGERDFGGTNYQTTRMITAAAVANKSVFMQVQGDFTNGGNASPDGHLFEYANFKRAIEPFHHMIPVYTGFGDHEPNKIVFTPDPLTHKSTSIDLFPYSTHSGEAVFAEAFVNPSNGPSSEDGATYDPDPEKSDFPTYKENVYYYLYDNTAIVVLNTEYWQSKHPLLTGGCPEGYIMDQQILWLKEVMANLEKNSAIDHIFVVVHGAVFPNGDHLPDAMWWNGENSTRAVVGGKPLEKGTIERRDELLDICVNRSRKFLAFISGDEHNFSYLQVKPEQIIYKEGYSGKKISLSRSFFSINNGAGGSAPYAMMESPWSSAFRYFTAPPVLALIHVNGKKVSLEAIRMETNEQVCTIQLR